MRLACYILTVAALVSSSSCTTSTVESNSFIDSKLAVNSLRNSVYDECGWDSEASTLTSLIPAISTGRDGFQRTTSAICAAAKGTPAPALPRDQVTVEVEGKLVRGRFLEPGETLAQD
ncbi:hypothetical protein FHS21_006084 [Phyllobacterium trifolii]|uniref:Lipoprotein n=1 Tax=Phyllobacterium trifolii TaxID=300193 RepID=A0A839UL84_9HYPH|nr:hypothetical protein [Phyllobacterium trifolii]